MKKFIDQINEKVKNSKWLNEFFVTFKRWLIIAGRAILKWSKIAGENLYKWSKIAGINLCKWSKIAGKSLYKWSKIVGKNLYKWIKIVAINVFKWLKIAIVSLFAGAGFICKKTTELIRNSKLFRRINERTLWLVVLGAYLVFIIAGGVFAYVMLKPSEISTVTKATETKQKNQKRGTYYLYGGANGHPIQYEPSKHSEIVAVASNNESVKVVSEERRGYYRVRYNGKEGFVKSEFLLGFREKPSEKIKTELNNEFPSYYVVNCSEYISMRKSRKATSKQIAKVTKGSRVRILSKARNGYYRVAYKNKMGYIPQKNLTKYKHPM